MAVKQNCRFSVIVVFINLKLMTSASNWELITKFKINIFQEKFFLEIENFHDTLLSYFILKSEKSNK